MSGVKSVNLMTLGDGQYLFCGSEGKNQKISGQAVRMAGADPEDVLTSLFEHGAIDKEIPR